MMTFRKQLALAGLGLAGSALMLSANAATVNVTNETEVQSGASADTDESETNYMFIKFSPASGDSSRKSYFQFDLSGENADLTKAATFSVFLSSNRGQALKFWALDQAYAAPGGALPGDATWNNIQANDTTSNDLLTTGALTATQIGGVVEFNGSTGDEISVELASLAPYVFDNKITLAISGTDWTGPNEPSSTVLNGGMRLGIKGSSNQAELSFEVVPEPSSLALLGLGGLLVARRRRG